MFLWKRDFLYYLELL